MLNLTFIRHAETTLNKSSIFCGKTDCDVTLEGLRQAKNLLKNKEKNFDFIYISPLKRTKHIEVNFLFKMGTYHVLILFAFLCKIVYTIIIT